jgi:uncharacterized RDD family membrane protein YckC
VPARQDRQRRRREGLSRPAEDAVLDNAVSTETPEGIVFELRPAGLAVRYCAFMLDWLIRLVIMAVAAAVAGILGGIGVAFWLVLLFVLEWFYPVFFELSASSASPGKRALGLRVVMDDGLPVTAAASMTRNVLRVADFLPFGFAFAIVCMLLRADCKRLGDLAAATLVVHEGRTERRAAAIDDVAPVVPERHLALREQAALIALAARASTLTSARLDELAGLAAPVAGHARYEGPALTRRVLGVAQWALGRR